MKTIVLLLLTAVLGDIAFGTVDLTPRYIDTFSEGVVSQRLYFVEEGRRFTIRLNRETEVTPDSGGALFRFSKVPGAAFSITRSPHKPTDPFEGVGLEKYRESARHLLPVAAKTVEIREEVANPLPINDWVSHRVLFAYQIGPRAYLQSVTYLNLSEQDQVVLITSALEKDFEEAAQRSFQLIRTWQEILPGDQVTPRSN